MALDRAFATGNRRERNFFLGFILVAWLGVILGFAPASWGRLQGRADYPAPLILHLHAMLFTAWMILLSAQVLLIRTGRRALHRRVGMGMAALIAPMVLTGFFAEAYSQRYYLAHPPNSQAFFIVPIFYVIAFGTLATLAVIKRREAGAHKRLIYLATSVIAGAAWTRLIGEPISQLVADGFWGMIGNTFTSTNLLMAALVAFDWGTLGRLHRVTLTVVPAILASELLVSWIYHAPGWLPVARALAQA